MKAQSRCDIAFRGILVLLYKTCGKPFSSTCVFPLITDYLFDIYLLTYHSFVLGLFIFNIVFLCVFFI